MNPSVASVNDAGGDLLAGCNGEGVAMRPCVIDPCGQPMHGVTPFCQTHWRRLNDRTQGRIYWTRGDWQVSQTASTAAAYHKAVALAVAELTAMQASVEAGRV